MCSSDPLCLKINISNTGEEDIDLSDRFLAYEMGDYIYYDIYNRPLGFNRSDDDPRYVSDTPMDHDAIKAAGSMFGTGAMIMLDETACVVEASVVIARFYEHESCGQCTPCREGTGWLLRICRRMCDLKGRPGDVELMANIADGIAGNTICPLGDAAAWPVLGFLTKFRDEFQAKIKKSTYVSAQGRRDEGARAGVA